MVEEPASGVRPGRFGPPDPENFFAAQRRHRRRARALAVLAGITSVGQSLLAALMFAPLTFVLVTLALDVAYRLGVPTPDTYELIESDADRMPLIGVLVLVGIALLFALWLLLRRSLRGGLAGAALTAGARVPDDLDAEEHELADVVAEMAIAAGVAPPRVLMVDGDGMNITVFGSSLRDATLVVPRSLLDGLGRRQTQALVGHQVASVANGDLLILNSVQALPIAWAVPARLMTHPFRRTTWRMGIGLVRLVFGRLPAEAEAALVEEVLTRTDRDVDDDEHRNVMLTFSSTMVWLSFSMMRMMADVAFVGPLLKVWVKRRRFLADAMAVQLTRDPDGLAGGLLSLTRAGGTMPGAGSVDMAAIVAVDTRRKDAPATPADDGVHRPGNPLGELGLNWHPELRKRLRRLEEFGHVPTEEDKKLVPPSRTARQEFRAHPIRSLLSLFVILPLVLLIIALMLIAGVLMLFLCIWPILLFYALPVYLILSPLHYWLRL